MKLAVIMNPPYQISDGGYGRSAKPLYHKFIEAIIDGLSPNYLVSLTPSRWMVGGKGLSKFRKRMMNDKSIKKIVHFPGEREVFPAVQIAGGVNYFLWDKNYSGKCEFVVGNTSVRRYLNAYDIIVQDNNAFGILEKVHSLHYISEKASSRKPFGLRANFADFTDEGVKCICERRVAKFVSSTSFTDNGKVFGKWKVCIPVAAGGHQLPNASGEKVVMMNIFIIEPEAICTETYMVINAFGAKKEAENFVSYVKTKFFRFLAGLRIVKNASKTVFSFVPDVEDYSTPWHDAELYDKFGLTRQERSYIEFKIKELS